MKKAHSTSPLLVVGLGDSLPSVI